MKSELINDLDILDFAKNCDGFDVKLFDKEKYGVIQVYENENQPVLFLKEVESFDFETLKQIAEIHKICWNFQKVLFLYVYSKTEIRIYNCSEKPFVYNEKNIEEKQFKDKLVNLEFYSCKQTDKQKLNLLNIIFSRIAIDTGFIWSSDEAIEIRKKLNLEKRVDKYLIDSLIKTANALEKKGLKNKFIIHKLIMRSLFLFYLEDRKATPIELYQQFSPKATSFFDILDDVEATYNLFEKLADDFNGSLFNFEEKEKDLVTKEHLGLIKNCFFDGYQDEANPVLFPDKKLFDFSIIRIELLSEIYENFLSKLDNKKKKDSGTFYTPPSLVELILNERLPTDKDKTNYQVKTLDPSCGSGIFLVQTFKRLVKRYENKHNEKLTDFTTLVEILKTNIFGIELDSKSIKVAAFSLYLALLDNLDPKTGWWNKTIQFPYLINDPDDKSLKEQGNNLFKRDTISDLSDITELQNFDLVVGNPPFGTKNLLPTIKAYCNKEKFAQEMVLPFLHKSTFLAPKGRIALIFNTKILTNTSGTYQKFREWLFNNNYVEKLYNFSILRKAPKFSGGQLFGSAVGPISIVFYQKEEPENPKDTITYYAPKTYIKNDILEGIIIDSSDEKHLPRMECEKPDTKIWKIAMWGSYFDFELIEKLDKNFVSLHNYVKANKENWDFTKGIMADSLKPEFIPSHIISPKLVERYLSVNNLLVPNSKYYRKIDKKFIKPPFLVFKEGQSNKKYCASIIENEEYFTNSLYGFYNNGDFRNSKVLCLFMNSNFSDYFLSISTSTWGIERERINLNELVTLPAVIDRLEESQIDFFSNIYDKIVKIKKSDDLIQDISHLEKEIDQIIYNDILKLTDDEQIIIQDTLDYSLDLFEKKEESNAVKPVFDIDHYINRITKELNDWLDDVDLKVSATKYLKDKNCPLYMLKLSFGDVQKETFESKENVKKELKILDQKLWNEESKNLYFRKKLNYYDGDDVYIIKPNQRRFWSQTAAMEDSKTLLIEILNMKK
ncbi:class I SAM-dependent DNA methyltransferase [Chryseobacterium sp. HMWF035]|uniref:HsdM family class I SAM-dependent methyltransferase n=2 Tax=unclassified Chryseobacterium TaxID=2593645 RepID=UPI000D573B40|nr:N-6 DNA methylase [Chryseobacterium sp. HMWF035]PVV61721.1 endonuclease [Chryseobacterium sp. HMWF035]